MKLGNKEKILQYRKPFIGLYPHLSNIMAMYENNEYIMPSLISEMIGMVYDKELNRIDFSISLEILQYMNNYPLVYSHGMGRNVIAKKWKKYSDFLVDMINEGYYVHNLLDTYYMSAYGETYGKQHYTHNSMVYGYDSSKQIFYLADAFEKGIYEARVVGFNEINGAFINTYINDWLDGIRLYKLKEDPFVGLGYNCKYIKEQCEKYLLGELPVCVNYIEQRRRIDLEDRFVHGIKIYDEIIDYLNNIENDGTVWVSADIRIFYGLYDHINIYGYLVVQLMQRKQIMYGDELYKKYRYLRDRIKNIYMLVIKYNLTGKRKTIETIVEILNGFKEDEKTYIRDFADSLIVDSEVMIDELVKTATISADSIMMEYNDEDSWTKKNIEEEVRYTNSDGGWMKCQFYGTAIKIRYRVGENYGQAQVIIDGKEIANIDYSILNMNYMVLENFDYGYHSMVIKNITPGKVINIECVEILDNSKFIQNASKAERISWKRNSGGNLIDDYGYEGYDIICGERHLPDYMTLSNYRFEGAVNVLLMHNTADNRGVKKNRGENNHIAAYALSDKEFSLEVTIPGKECTMTMYFVDYDNLARCMRLVVENADTGKIYDTCDIEGFTNGNTISYKVKGHLRFRFIRVAGPDAVLSAIYFDR